MISHPAVSDVSYHVIPDGDVRKPYALFREAMKQRGQYAIAKVAMHNREHIVVIRPDGNELMLHTMFFANEIQQAEVRTGSEEFDRAEAEGRTGDRGQEGEAQAGVEHIGRFAREPGGTPIASEARWTQGRRLAETLGAVSCDQAGAYGVTIDGAKEPACE